MLACLFTSFSAFSQGVNFEHLTFQEALNKAKAEKKLVFLDCYTTWCGPCIQMANNIFPKEEVGDFFNKNFVNIKIDMEKGEGPELMKKYGIAAFPTFLILLPDGTERHRMLGSSDEKGIIDRAQKGLKVETSSSHQDKLFADGKRDKAFLTTYVQDMLDSYQNVKAAAAAPELMAQLSDEEKLSKDYLFIYFNNTLTGLGSANFNYMIQHKDKFIALHGEHAINERIHSLLMNRIQQIMAGRGNFTTSDLDNMKKDIPTYRLSSQKELLASLEIAKSFMEKNPTKMLATCEKEFKLLTDSSIRTVGFPAVNYLKQEITQGQKGRLKKAVDAMAATAQNERMKEQIKKLLD